MRSFVRAGVLAGVSVVALSTAPGFAAGMHPALQSAQAKAHGVPRTATDRSLSVLYDQTSNPSGQGTFSQNFGDGNNGSAAADDFTVPDGQVWTIEEIDVGGMYFNGSGPATENVTFFKDKNGKVGKVVDDLEGLHGADNAGSFAITLGKKGVKLKSGHYWVAVVADMSDLGVEWAWENQTAGTSEGDPAMWENPGGDYCQTWTSQHDCGGTLGDEVFTLKGKAK